MASLLTSGTTGRASKGGLDSGSGPPAGYRGPGQWAMLSESESFLLFLKVKVAHLI